MWKIVEASLEKIRLGRTEGGRDQRGSREKTRKVEEEETKGEEAGGGEESSRGIGDWG